MRHKKKGIVIERQPRIDPREHHRTSHKPVGPLGLARTRSETTEEPSRISTTLPGHPYRHNDMSSIKKHRAPHRHGRRRR